MKRWLIVALLVVCFVGASRQRASASMASASLGFSLVVTSTPTGWAAHCDTGCHWTDLAFACRSACSARVDANGLVTGQTARVEPSAFAFRLDRSRTGFSAVAERGTAWRTVSWSCRSRSCSARIDSFGIGPE